MTARRVIRYIVTEQLSPNTQQHWTVDFLPATDCPGYSHRVIIDGQFHQHWLSNSHSPVGKSAIYFIQKHKLNKNILKDKLTFAT